MGFVTTIFIVGRVLLGGFFLYNAYNHFRNSSDLGTYALSRRVPLAKAAVITSGIILALGGLAIVANYYIVLGMVLLVIVLTAITMVMHAFWKMTDPQTRANEKIQFTKNLAIIGSLCMLIAIGLMIG